MNQKSFPNLKKLSEPSKIKPCRACGLYLNQLPALDNFQRSQVFWVGLSAVQFDETEEKLPLAPHTRTGNLIEEIEKPFKKTICFYKTNIVKCVPLKGEKIRYPITSEMEKCYPNFEDELKYFKPKIVFLLGKQVASFIYKKFDLGTVSFSETFSYSYEKVGNTLFVPIHHPSFILVYKRKFTEEYINSIREFLMDYDKNDHTKKKQRTIVKRANSVGNAVGAC